MLCKYHSVLVNSRVNWGKNGYQKGMLGTILVLTVGAKEKKKR
jgi:hypothetical protein